MALDGTHEIKTWKMATLSSLQDRLQGIGSRLQAEKDSQDRLQGIGSRLQAEKQSLMTNSLTLDFNRERPGSERRPKNGECLFSPSETFIYCKIFNKDVSRVPSYFNC